MTNHSDDFDKTNPSTLDIKYFKSLFPAPECVICGKTLEQTGGRRITAQNMRGMTISHKVWTLRDRENLQHCERLIDDQEIYLIVWGEAKVWTPEVIERIKNTYLSGVRPWMCQGSGCGNRECSVCGKANNFPVASDLLYDNGETRHLMVIPADCGCVNQGCKKFSNFDKNGGIVKINSTKRRE